MTMVLKGDAQPTSNRTGPTQTYVQPGWWCDACEEGILESDDNEFADAALHEVMVRAKRERGDHIMHKTDSE